MLHDFTKKVPEGLSKNWLKFPDHGPRLVATALATRTPMDTKSRSRSLSKLDGLVNAIRKEQKLR